MPCELIPNSCKPNIFVKLEMKVLLLLTLVGVTLSQLVGDLKKNEPLPLEIQECTGSMSCTPGKTLREI